MSEYECKFIRGLNECMNVVYSRSNYIKTRKLRNLFVVIPKFNRMKKGRDIFRYKKQKRYKGVKIRAYNKSLIESLNVSQNQIKTIKRHRKHDIFYKIHLKVNMQLGGHK